jgi:hypothetical protein
VETVQAHQQCPGRGRNGKADMHDMRRNAQGQAKKVLRSDVQEPDTNNRHQNYSAQRARGLLRKLMFIDEGGGRCARCGYNKNSAALTWHHLDPAQKAFELDLRNLSNRSESVRRSELGKCVLLCANCHAEVHHPHMAWQNTRSNQKKGGQWAALLLGVQQTPTRGRGTSAASPNGSGGAACAVPWPLSGGSARG